MLKLTNMNREKTEQEGWKSNVGVSRLNARRLWAQVVFSPLCGVIPF